MHSTFREFDNEALLNSDFSQTLKDNWWHGIKHSLALLGHIAPYVWKHQINTMYIAASFCKQDGKVRCASDPSIDNQVRFSDCQVVHDGYEYSRQDKIHNLVEFCKKIIDIFICMYAGSHRKGIIAVCVKNVTGQWLDYGLREKIRKIMDF